ncbi:MAG: phosphoribosylglycinamide formyltransferase [Thermoleophilaceae bacterium]|nr:phosphoribosylglycinamide formyltransferase [Thermoleophilaceae bacterium]
MRIVVLVSGEGTNLQALIDGVHGQGGIEIVGVAASRPEAPGLERARRAEIPAACFEIADFADRDARDGALGDWIEGQSAELVVLAGWMQLLSRGLVERLAGAIINVHPALLPAFPGLHAIEQAIAHGVKVAGVTVHFVDEGVDSGPIILQRAFDLPYAASVERIEEIVHGIEHELLPRAVRLIAKRAVRRDPKNPRVVLIEEEHESG